MLRRCEGQSEQVNASNLPAIFPTLPRFTHAHTHTQEGTGGFTVVFTKERIGRLEDKAQLIHDLIDGFYGRTGMTETEADSIRCGFINSAQSSIGDAITELKRAAQS